MYPAFGRAVFDNALRADAAARLRVARHDPYVHDVPALQVESCEMPTTRRDIIYAYDIVQYVVFYSLEIESEA